MKLSSMQTSCFIVCLYQHCSNTICRVVRLKTEKPQTIGQYKLQTLTLQESTYCAQLNVVLAPCMYTICIKLSVMLQQKSLRFCESEDRLLGKVRPL